MACQVNENITPSLQSSGVSSEKASPLQVKYPEEGWYKLNDIIKIELLHTDRIIVKGTPYIKTQVGVKLGIEYNCLPASDCPRSQPSGLSYIRFDPKNFLLKGSFTVLLPGGARLPIKFGALSNGVDTICSRCLGEEMAQGLKTILENRVGQTYKAKLNKNSVALSTERRFYYSSGSGTNKITFQYTVSENDLDIDGIELSEAIEPASSIFVYNFNQNPTLAQYQLSFDGKLLWLDGDAPQILTVTPPPDGFYDTGKSLRYKLTFSENVFVSDSPSLGLSLTSAIPIAEYSSGSGTSTLILTKEILNEDSNTQPITTNEELSMSTDIKDRAGNSVLRTLPRPLSTSNVIVNASSPTIQSISLVSNLGTYNAGGIIEFEVVYSESVNVATNTGLPALNLKLQTGIYEAKYKSGTGTNKLRFEYIVQFNHASTNIEVLSPLLLNGGKIKSQANNKDAVLIFTRPVPFTGITVDSLSGPYIKAVIPPDSGFYKEGSELIFTFHYSSPVSVSGPAPQIPLLIGNKTKYAIHSPAQSESNNGKLVFTYTTTNLDEDVDGIFISAPVENFSSIKDLNGKNSIPSFIAPSTRGIKIDGTTPTIKSVATPATGVLLGGMDMDFIVEFSEDVTHTGTPTLPFQLSCAPNCPDKTATFISKLSGSKYLFRYKIQNTDSSSGVTVLSPTETYFDQVAHSANLTLSTEQSNKSGFIIDAVVPEMISFTPPANKTSYKVGDVLDFKITWKNPVIVNGVPVIKFELRDSATVTAEATYIQDPAAPLSTETRFSYIVKANDKASLGIKLVKLELNGGSISDASGNSAIIPSLNDDLPGVKIDGIRPVIVEQTTPQDKVYKIGDTLFFSVSWNEPVNILGTPYILLEVGDKNVKALYNHTTDGRRASFQYKIMEINEILDLNGIKIDSEVYLNQGDSITDYSGNPASLSFRPRDLTGVKVDGVRPYIEMFMGPENGNYVQGSRIEFKIFWSEPVVINGTPQIEMTLVGTNRNPQTATPEGTKNVFASCTSCTSSAPTTKSDFSWNVTADKALDKISLTFPYNLILTTVTIQDTAGNFIAIPTNLVDPFDFNGTYPGVKVNSP